MAFQAAGRVQEQEKILMLRMLSRLISATGLIAVAVLATGPVRAAEVDRYLPDDTPVVVHANVRQILDSPVFQKYGADKLKESLTQHEELGKFLAAAGIDPRRDVSSVTLAVTGATSAQGVAVIHGSFDLSKVHPACEQVAKAHPDALAIHPQGSTRIYEGKNKGEGKPVFAAFVSRDTLVVSPSREYVVGTLAKAAGEKRVVLNKELQALVARANDKESVWIAALATEDLKKELAKNTQTRDLAAKLVSFTGEIAFTNAIRTALYLRTSDARAAADLSSFLDGIKGFFALATENVEHYGPLLSEVIDSMKIASEQSTVTISGTVTDEMITKGLQKGVKPQ